MRRNLVLAALLLPLSGCYLPPQGPTGYAQPGYPPPGYPPQGYPQAAYDPYGNVYPGYSYNDGTPTLLVEGAPMPLIVVGGGWGYWDSRHNWHRAPDEISRHLEQQHASGGFRPGGGGFAQPRPEGGPPPHGGFHAGDGHFAQPRPEGRPPQAAPPNGGQAFSHPPGQGPAAAVPAAAVRPAGAPRPEPAHQEHQRGHECPPGQRC
jgi:hypothetical protein